MCGILGEFTFNLTTLSSKEAFLKLVGFSSRRGPDHKGYSKVDNYCQLGHNRLSILDLSPNAHQPISSPSGRYHLVYNGEVYNHKEIRNKLPRDYYTFRGNSDTETLIVAFEYFGFEPVIEWCDGMFALVLYDRQEQQLWLARDFAGIKPLFYGWNSQTFVFASQYDQIAAHPAFASEGVDPAVLKLYLEQHFMPAPFGLLCNTGQLHPGEIMRIDKAGKIHRRRYWELPVTAEPSIRDQKQALEFLKAELNQSVQAELMSDVPLGAFLSGGIDSPLVCYSAKKHATGRFKAFSIGSDSKVHDESEDATTYAQLIGLEHHLEQMQAQGAADILQEVSAALHEPLADFSIIPTYLVSRLARREVTVALSGDGGDELFFGYERFWSLAKNIRFQSLPYPLKYLIYGTDRFFFRNQHINSAVLAAQQGQAHRGQHSRFSAGLIHNIAPDLSSVPTPKAFSVYDYPRTSNVSELLGYMRRAEFYGMMQKTLRKVDLASMENSLEVRVPMLKKSFIEASLKISPFLSYGPNCKKQLLKDLLKKELPQSPVDNRKRGFTVPLSGWLRQQLKELFADTLLNDNHLKNLGFEPERVHQLWQMHQKGERDYKWPLFTLFALLTYQVNRAK